MVESLTCCCGSHNCTFTQTSAQIISDLKKDLQTAAQAGMQLLRQGQEAEEHLKSQLEDISAENLRLSNQNVQLLAENTHHSQLQLEAEQKAADLEAALVAARGRAQQLKSYHSLALALEEQVTALEALRASLEAERDSALADSAAYERKWRASQQMAVSVQNAFDALEASIANAPFDSTLGSNVSQSSVQGRASRLTSTPRRTPVPLTPDTSIDDSLAAELAAFEMRPKLRRAASHESVLAPPTMPKFAPYAPIAAAAPGISVAAPEVVVVNGLRAAPPSAARSARGFLGNFRR